MKEMKVQPNEETYEKMIRLCLTQDVYEDAFYYLEEMKAAEFVPPQTVYKALVLKCHSMNDTRMDIALEEMRECGYRIPTSLKANRPFIGEPEKTRSPSLDEKTLEYIRTGGMSS